VIHLENKDDISISSPAQAPIGKDEFEEFELEILGLLTSELDSDYVELSSEIDCLEAQIKIDTESYSSSQMQIANEVDHCKKGSLAMKIELEKRLQN
jgi:uncharacterized protein YdcH (DUF465 family)